MATPALENRAKARRRGFTLVEIMLTLALLAGALTLLLTARARAVKSIRGIEQSAVAQGLAERVLATRISSQAIAAGEERGEVDGYPGYSYHVVIQERVLPVPEKAGEESKEKDEGKDKSKTNSRLYEIAATVRYKDFGQERSFSATTLFYDQPALRGAEERKP